MPAAFLAAADVVGVRARSIELARDRLTEFATDVIKAAGVEATDARSNYRSRDFLQGGCRKSARALT